MGNKCKNCQFTWVTSEKNCPRCGFDKHHEPREIDFDDLNAKQRSALELKVPRSGLPWLDDMITESRRLEIAAQAMAALITSHVNPNAGDPFAEHSIGSVSKTAFIYADAILIKSKEVKP